jgi:hypothetical protein
MKKFKYLILLLLSFFILFFPQAISAGSGVSEYWHNSISLQVYYSNVYIEDSPSVDTDYAYYDPYDEEEGEEEWGDEWEEEEEIETEPETVELQIKRAKAGIMRNMTITGGIMGALPPLIFAAAFSYSGYIHGYGVLAATAGGTLLGSASGNVFARAMISLNQKNAAAGFLIGVPLGTLFGALTGTAAGGLLLLGSESSSDDWIDVGPEVGIFVGAIVGAVVGSITGGIAGVVISESLGRLNIERRPSPRGEITTYVKIPDSSGVKTTLVEVPKPPLRMSKISTEVIVGALSGYCLGVICELKFRKNNLAWAVAGVTGTTIGVYSTGNRNNETGNFLGTLLLSSVGMALSFRFISGSEYRQNRSLFLGGSPVVASIFAAFAFNVSRSYTSYQGVDVGLLNFKDDRVILGNPAMYVYSDPFKKKEVAYGLELFKFKF